MFKVFTLAMSLAVYPLMASAAFFKGTETLSGTVVVLDGDTVDFDEGRVRIHGIDAPEGAQSCRSERGDWACGRAATRAMERLTHDKKVTCEGRGVDDYGRLLGVCKVDGVDVGASLIRQGLAWAFVKYSRTYVQEEAEARLERRGVFAVENTPPWDFRSARWEGARKAADADRGRECPIKGNISRNGNRIYHMPWQTSYPRTKINERMGERWFCSAVEAEKAGWRQAR